MIHRVLLHLERTERQGDLGTPMDRRESAGILAPPQTPRTTPFILDIWQKDFVNGRIDVTTVA